MRVVDDHRPCIEASLLWRLSHDVARNDIALDLVGAFDDLQHLGVSKVGNSLEMPAAPKGCTASVATRIAVSLAWHFAIAAMVAKALPPRPESTADAARYTNWRDASICIAMSAIIQRTPWNSLTC